MKNGIIIYQSNYLSAELEVKIGEKSTVRKIRTVRKEGNREVSRDLTHYNLDMIISIGYRVNSPEFEGIKNKAGLNRFTVFVKHGKGFSLSNLYLIRQFFLLYPKIQTLSGESKISEKASHLLSWSYYVELLKIFDKLKVSLKDLGKKWFAFFKMNKYSVTIINSISEMI